jgi:glycolate oxidase iron-sulfur subunit
LLRDDVAYSAKAIKISALCKDLIEYLPTLQLAQNLAQKVKHDSQKTKVAFHPPCTLQHAQQIKGVVESLLVQCGVDLQPVGDSHLCCGSAGTYSVLQPELSKELRKRKLDNLQANKPEIILSANIGCLTHLQSGTTTPVRHWIEWLDEVLIR